MDDQPFLPKLIARSNDITGDSNFTQGCKFSPDGLCILTSTASDNLLRLYNTPSMPQKQETQEKQEHEGKSEGVKDISTVADADISWKTILSAKGGDSVRSLLLEFGIILYVISYCSHFKDLKFVHFLRFPLLLLLISRWSMLLVRDCCQCCYLPLWHAL
jgi:WD40 repeat protein